MHLAAESRRKQDAVVQKDLHQKVALDQEHPQVQALCRESALARLGSTHELPKEGLLDIRMSGSSSPDITSPGP